MKGLYNDTVEEYMQGVLSGSVTACSWVKLAVRRHYQDLDKGGDRGLYFDEGIANEAISYFPEVCVHTKGEWTGQPFQLQPWQMFVLWCVFGWRKKEDDCRRFTWCYCTLARKAGKSEFSAGIALLLTTFDDPIEPAADVFTAATKEEQAMIVYQTAADMVAYGTALTGYCDVQRKKMTYSPTNSKLMAIGSDGKTQDGLNPHGIIIDELHAWYGNRHQEFWNKLTTGSGARRQPLTVVITTAGDDKSEIWIRFDSYCCSILDGVESGNIVSDNVFAFIARLDDEDDIFDEANWGKANPSYPVTPKKSYLAERMAIAKTNQVEENIYARYACNKMVASHAKAIDPRQWQACRVDVLPDVKGKPCLAAFDVGRSDDFCSIGLVWPLGDRSGNDQTVVKTWSFTCEERANHLSSTQFEGFIKAGSLIVNPGDEVDYKLFINTIVDLHKRYDVDSWTYDPSFATVLAQSLLNDHNLPISKMIQTPKNYNAPFRQFAKSVREGRVIHDGDACLDWQMSNLTVTVNTWGEWQPDKSHNQNKIDAPVSLLMAFREACLAEKQPRPNIY